MAGDNVVPATWGNPDTLQEHISDHAANFGIDPNDPNAADDYANLANDFLQRAFDEGLPTKIESEGYIRVYDPESNTFGSYNPDGTTRTFFMPREGQVYFDGQAGELYVGGKPANQMPAITTAEPEAEPPPRIIVPINTEPTLEEDQSIRGGGGGNLIPHPRTDEIIDDEEPKL